MKTFDTFLKLATAMVAIGAAIYAIAKYGDKLVAWAKRLCPCCGEYCAPDSVVYEAPAAAPVEEAPVEAPVAEEAPAEEPVEAEEAPAVEEAPAEEPASAVEIPEGEPVAEEEDFAD